MASNARFAEVAAIAGDPTRAGMLHALMDGRALTASELARKRLVVGPRDAALRKARTCYDHLAGQLGVALADALVAAGHAELARDGGIVTDTGVEFLGRIGIDMTGMRAQCARKSGRVLCRPCLDWSERRPHLAGMVG